MSVCLNRKGSARTAFLKAKLRPAKLWVDLGPYRHCLYKMQY